MAFETLFGMAVAEGAVAERKAEEAWALVSQFLTFEECEELAAAAYRAGEGGGRKDWDEACGRIRERLGLEEA